MMIEGSGSGSGSIPLTSVSGSIPLTSGSGSGSATLRPRSKKMVETHNNQHGAPPPGKKDVSSLFAKQTAKPQPAYDYSKVPERASSKRKNHNDSDDEMEQVREVLLWFFIKNGAEMCSNRYGTLPTKIGDFYQ
jgi:hypothetical protein